MEKEGCEEQSGRDYQVFLSFRGPDTRQGFTDCLYHFLTNEGIRVFRDDEEHRFGDPISKIMDAVGNSVIGIPIFSTNFASSKWCLRELTKMVELDLVIMPIFYDVTPNVVKLRKKSPYIRAIENAAAGVDFSEVEKWKRALKKVGGFRGGELKDTGYGEFCMSIVNEVLTKLKAKQKIVTTQLVGMKEKIETVMRLLNVESTDVRFVGIHGMGGIGKTTLAKIVFNRISGQFDYCSFVNDIRESSKHGLAYLQKQILINFRMKSMEISDTSDGIKKIKDIMRDKKVLIVLDDVDQKEQVDQLAGKSSWFGPGSRIIITTRDKSVLTVARETTEKIMSFEIMEMNQIEALQLFSLHAFGEDRPPPGYLDLSRAVVSTVGKLPLALEIIGSHFHGKHKEEWIESIKNLGRIPNKDVQKKLRISYEALDHRAKQIFLDIACFFCNKEKTSAIYMWKACNFHPESGVEDLVSKSLVKITDDNKLWMHDQLRDLGREIVCEESLQDLGMRSRLWMPEEASAMLTRREGTRKVEAVSLSYDDGSMAFRCTHKQFRNLRNLRFLECHGRNLTGNFRYQLSKLIWLSWHFCPQYVSATNLIMESLVILDLSRSNIDENWNGWRQMQVGGTLKVLDLTGCTEIRITPDVSKYRTLERLVIQDCKGLKEIHRSIGMLKNITHLNAKGCHMLQGFPAELCSLDTLEEILMEGDGQPFSLPSSIGNLSSLTVLEVTKVRIDHGLPESLVQLKKLRRLSLSRCKGVIKLPNSFGELNALVELDLSQTDISTMPDSLGDLVNLQRLNLRNCSGIKELPSSIGKLSSLTELDLSGISATQLQGSIGNLRELKALRLTISLIKSLPSSIGGLEKLEELDARGSGVEVIPKELGMLSHLKCLVFRDTKIRQLPSLSKLSSLQTLNLKGCPNLDELPELPTSLTTLAVDSKSLKRLPNLSKFDKLVNLHLAAGTKLQPTNLNWIGKLTGLVELVLRLHNITQLPTDFRSFLHLKELTLSCPGAPYSAPILESASLTKVVLQHIDSKRKLPDLSQLKNLTSLNIDSFSIGDGLGGLGIGELEWLQFLYISNCGFIDLSDMYLPKSLIGLHVKNCRSLKASPNLSHLTNLAIFYLWNCEEIVEIPGVGDMESLEILNICGCDSLKGLDNLSKLVRLRTVIITSCKNISVLYGLYSSDLKNIDAPGIMRL